MSNDPMQVPTEPTLASMVSPEGQKEMIDAVKPPEPPADTAAAAPPPPAPAAPPAPPEKYDIKINDDVLELSEKELELFKEVGLSNEHAQKLVDHLQETLIPQLMEVKVELETERLMNAWQMQDKEALAQRLTATKDWAEKNLPPAVVKEMSRTSNGVVTLYNMMQTGAKIAPASQSQPAASREKLLSMMNEQKYWDGSDPAYRKEVEEYAARLAGA